MKVNVAKRYGHWQAVVTQGHQQFVVGYEGTRDEARWMASMFRIAIHNHDKERDGERNKSRDQT